MPEAKEYDLRGVKTCDLCLFPDERGSFGEALREDWSGLMEGDRIVQANMSYNYPGIIRAWHRHARGQVDYFLVLEGAVRICVYDDREDSPTAGRLIEIVASAQKPQLVRVPGVYWHGIKAVGSEPSLMIYFTTRLYNYDDPDEERRPWNDATIVDPETGKPFDWNEPPHR